MQRCGYLKNYSTHLEKFRYNIVIKDSYLFIKQFVKYFKSGLDELAIAYSILKNNIKLNIFSPYEYNSFPQFSSTNSVVVHFMGGA